MTNPVLTPETTPCHQLRNFSVRPVVRTLTLCSGSPNRMTIRVSSPIRTIGIQKLQNAAVSAPLDPLPVAAPRIAMSARPVARWSLRSAGASVSPVKKRRNRSSVGGTSAATSSVPGPRPSACSASRFAPPKRRPKENSRASTATQASIAAASGQPGKTDQSGRLCDGPHCHAVRSMLTTATPSSRVAVRPSPSSRSMAPATAWANLASFDVGAGSMNWAALTKPNGRITSQSPCRHDPEVNLPQW